MHVPIAIILYDLSCWVKHVQRSHQDSRAELEEDKAISIVSQLTQCNMPLNRFLSNSENKDQLTT